MKGNALQVVNLARWRALALLVAFAMPCVGSAAPVEVNTTITSINAQATFGNGDVLIKVGAPPSGCAAGFWLRKGDPGFNVLSALVLSAYHAQSPVRVSGEDSVLWPGSGSAYRLITAVTGT